MSTRITVRVAPRTKSRPMVVRMSGGTIPVVTIGDDEWADAEVSIQLGNTDAPAKWLRESAAALLNLADQIGARAEVSA